MHGTTITPRVVLARGTLFPRLGDANVLPPASGDTQLLWYSDASFKHNPDGTPDQIVGFATRYRRIIVSLETDQDGTIRVSESADGINYDFVSNNTYTAATPATHTVSVHPQRPWMKIFFVNGGGGASTTWRFSIVGDESSADSGA